MPKAIIIYTAALYLPLLIVAELYSYNGGVKKHTLSHTLRYAPPPLQHRKPLFAPRRKIRTNTGLVVELVEDEGGDLRIFSVPTN